MKKRYIAIITDFSDLEGHLYNYEFFYKKLSVSFEKSFYNKLNQS